MSLPGNYNLIGDSHIASATYGQFFNTCELLTNGSTRTRAQRIHYRLQHPV